VNKAATGTIVESTAVVREKGRWWEEEVFYQAKIPENSD
jgi:hypothetical protein